MPRKVPVLIQAEQADCGLTAIAMIAHHFGLQFDMAMLRQQFGLHRGGSSLKSLLPIASAVGLTARPVRLELADIRQLRLPAMLHWDFDHFVVITKIKRRGAVIHDPAVGRRDISNQTLQESFTGVAVEFGLAHPFHSEPGARAPGIAAFTRSVQGLAKYLGWMLVLLLATQFLALVPPVATQLLIDEVVLGQDRQWLYGVLVGIALVMTTMLGIDVLRRWVALYAGTRLAAESTSAVVQHVFQLPVATVERRSVGDLISRIESLQPVRTAITDTCLNGVVHIVVLLTTLAVMLMYSVQLTLLSIGAVILVALLHVALLPAMRAANLEAVVAGAQSSQSLIESLRSFHAVKALGLSAERLAHWQRYFLVAINAGARQARLGIISGFGHGFVGSLEQLLFLGVGITGVVNKQITLGVLFAFLSLRGRVSVAVVQLLAVARELYLLRSHIDRVGELVLQEADHPPSANALRTPIRGAIDCSGLSFRYPGCEKVINNFDCSIAAGESVIIAGPSGAGKTTLLNLFSTGLKADSGVLRIDSIELPLWDLDALRQQFGIVLQQDLLFQGSVADNISGFESAPDLGRIREAAYLAEIWPDIQSLPMHIHTPVAASGGGLSGGQTQRLLLARALYRQPRILFLDEATSHLDEATETRVLTNLKSLRITIISVAHSENAMKFSGRRLYLRPGVE